MNVKKVSELLRFNPEKMQKVNLFESNRMFCDIYCLEPGQEQALHDHKENDKIYFVLEGRGSFWQLSFFSKALAYILAYVLAFVMTHVLAHVY